MRRLLVLVFLIFHLSGFTQSLDFFIKEFKDSLDTDFSKIDKSRLDKLVPFKRDYNWGFLDKETKQEVLPPCFTFIDLFHPNLVAYAGDFIVEIKRDPFSIDVYKQKDYCDRSCRAAIQRVFVISSKTGFTGFSVTVERKLESYSDIYYIDENRRDISDPFEYEYEYFAIVNRNGACGIIDVFGEPLTGFDFNYKKIILNDFANDKVEKWFFVEDFNNNRFFINTKGEKIMENKNIVIPLFKNMLFGLSVVHNGEESGVFDLHKMNWMIPLQTKYDIDGLYYSSKKSLNDLNPLNRKLVDIYFLVRMDKEELFVDEKLNPYYLKE